MSDVGMPSQAGRKLSEFCNMARGEGSSFWRTVQGVDHRRVRREGGDENKFRTGRLSASFISFRGSASERDVGRLCLPWRINNKGGFKTRPYASRLQEYYTETDDTTSCLPLSPLRILHRPRLHHPMRRLLLSLHVQLPHHLRLLPGHLRH